MSQLLRYSLRDFAFAASLSCLVLIGVAPRAMASDNESAAAHAETTTDQVVSAASVGMSAEPLAAGVAAFREAVQREEIRGAVLLVARRGQLVLHAAVGMSDQAARRPMTLETVFHVASNTKPIVAALAHRFAEQGRLDLDADVGAYLPAFQQDAYRGVTMRRLLNHTSGLRIAPIFHEPLSEKSTALPTGPTLRSEVDRFAKTPPAVAPGTSYSYNNPGYNIAGAVLEVVGGKPLDQLLAENFYAPLGMTSAQHRDQPGIVERRAVVETRKDGVWSVTYKPGDPPKYPFVRGSGGLLITARDYARFLQLFLDDGQVGAHVLLKPETIRDITSAQTRDIYTQEQLVNQTTFYGSGWQVFADGRYGHGGSDGTFAWVDPRRELVAIVFTQSPGGKIPTEEFRRRVEEACPLDHTFAAGPVGHRGLPSEFPENTLAGFRACLDRRFGFEVDVRRSKDGQLVCVHDETVDRTTNGKGRVDSLELAELNALDAGSWFSPRYKNARIPSFDEVLQLIARYDAARPVVAIDLKGGDPNIEQDVVAAARTHRVLDRLVFIGRAIQSPEVRRKLRAADVTAQVARLVESPDQLAEVLADRDVTWAYLRYMPERKDVDQTHQAGKRLFVAGPLYAASQPENWRRAAVRGVDAILTDFPDALAKQLRDDSYRRAELQRAIAPYTQPPAEYRGDFGPYASPRRFADGSEAQTPADWTRRRSEIARDWEQLLGGPWPARIEKPTLRIVATERRENLTQHRVEVEVLPGQRYSAGHLLIPEGPGPFPAALVTFYESATSVGLGERGRGTHDYGLQLARRGFVTLSIGTPNSVEFSAPMTREALTAAGEQLDRQPLSILAYAAASGHQALAQLPSVDARRIGVIGLSYGGKWAMFASCLHEPFACAVWSDPGIVFNEKNGNVNYWEPWYLGYEQGTRRPAGIPNAERPRTGLYKRLFESQRDLHELHQLMAPRPVLVSGGTEDPPRNWRALNHLLETNRILGVSGNVALTQRATHVPTPEALELELRFLELHLKYQ